MNCESSDNMRWPVDICGICLYLKNKKEQELKKTNTHTQKSLFSRLFSLSQQRGANVSEQLCIGLREAKVVKRFDQSKAHCSCRLASDKRICTRLLVLKTWTKIKNQNQNETKRFCLFFVLFFSLDTLHPENWITSQTVVRMLMALADTFWLVVNEPRALAGLAGAGAEDAGAEAEGGVYLTN